MIVTRFESFTLALGMAGVPISLLYHHVGISLWWPPAVVGMIAILNYFMNRHDDAGVVIR